MSTTPPVALPRPLELDDLEQLTVALVAGLDDGTDPVPEVLGVGVVPTADQWQLAIKPLEGADPIASLVGFDAPADWQAMGIVATGRWFALADDESVEHPPPRRRRSPAGRVRMANLATRNGDIVAVLSRDGEAPQVSHHDPATHHGRADDVCRRALGLPTAPPTLDTKQLWALVWCDLVTERVLESRPPSWTEVAMAHPAIGQLGLVDADATAWAVDNLVRLGREYADLHPWDELHRLCAGGQWPMTGIEPDDASWMDLGMFSRWALAPYPELAELLDDLAVLLPVDTAYRLWRTIDAWGLP